MQVSFKTEGKVSAVRQAVATQIKNARKANPESSPAIAALGDEVQRALAGADGEATAKVEAAIAVVVKVEAATKAEAEPAAETAKK